MRNLFIIAFALAAVVPLHAAEKVDDPAAVFESVYGARFRGVTQTAEFADDLVLARDLLDAARASSDNLQLLAILTEKSYELASRDNSGYDTAIDAVALQGTFFPERRPEAAERALELAQQRYNSATPQNRKRLGERLIDVLLAKAQIAADQHQFADAVDTLQRAQSVAKTIRSDRTDPILRAHAEVVAARRESDRLEALRGQAADGDGEAANALVKHHLLSGEPRQAVKFADQAGDAVVAQIARLAVEPVEALTPEQALRLGDWLRNAAILTDDAAKGPLLQHAYHAYQRFLAGHPADDLSRKAAKLALDDTIKALRSAGAPVPGETIDLLKMIDVERDVRMGWAERTPEGVVLSQLGERVKVAVPVKPQGSYEVRVRFSRQDRHPLAVLLPLDEQRRPYLVLSAFVNSISGIGLIHGKNEKRNGTAKPSEMPPGGTYDLRIIVQQDTPTVTISAWLDGERHVHWQGPKTALSSNGYWEVPDPGVLVFGTWNGPVTIHSAELQMLSGNAEMPVQRDPILVEAPVKRTAPARGEASGGAPGRVLPDEPNPARPTFFGIPIE